MEDPEMRVVGYIDGMNFYEASKDQAWYPAGWCNWTETLGVYCPGAEVSVRYFTSLYVGRDMKQVRRQKLHILAMEKEAHAEIILGSCRRRPLVCPNCRTLLKCPRAKCGCDQRLAEKMTDVNIAVRMLEDAIDGLFDRAYLVSADVDLLPAIKAVLRRAPSSQVIVLLPPGAVMAGEFAELNKTYPRRAIALYLDLGKLRRFPDELPHRWGMRLPPHWREGAGKRPLAPESEADSCRPGHPVPWFEESVGFGTESALKRPRGPR
jgi:hypothetical protein